MKTLIRAFLFIGLISCFFLSACTSKDSGAEVLIDDSFSEKESLAFFSTLLLDERNRNVAVSEVGKMKIYYKESRTERAGISGLDFIKTTIYGGEVPMILIKKGKNETFVYYFVVYFDEILEIAGKTDDYRVGQVSIRNNYGINLLSIKGIIPITDVPERHTLSKESVMDEQRNFKQ
jgi:hypothetical protein